MFLQNILYPAGFHARFDPSNRFSAVVTPGLSRWQIETEDLTEFDAVNVKPGDVVTIAFDALPDLQKDGVVKLVRPIGENNRGDIVYTLVIEPSEHDARLLWNMTAVVTLAK